MGRALNIRLEEFARSASAFLAALWIDTLSPETALAELFGKRDPLSLLQKARFLLDLGRSGDAAEVLGELGELPAGLAAVRAELLAAIEGEGPGEAAGEVQDLASSTLAELHARQGDLDAAAAMYREVLKRDPTHAQARSRLAELTGAGRPGADQALASWLARVRRWRSEHGV